MIKIKTLCVIAAIAMLSGCNNSSTDSSAKPSKDSTAAIEKPKSFVGTWVDKENYHIVEIADTAGKYRIRERYGVDENRGTEFFANNVHDTLKAEGKEADFYKLQLPSFRFLPNDKLYYDFGAGPDTLRRSEKPFPNPNCKYLPPSNND